MLEAGVHEHAQLICDDDDWDPIWETSYGLYFCHEGKRLCAFTGRLPPFTCRVDVQTECIQMRRCALRSTTFTLPSDRMYFSGMGMTASTKGGITMLLEMKKHRVTSERHWRM